MIEVSNLTKRYGSFEAVKGVSFTVEEDQVLGFLGPNGAGKTTIMKILTGFHFATEGSARLNGIDVLENPVEVKKLIGYLPEGVPLYGELTVEEYLSFIADVRQVPKEERARRIDAVLESCGLTHMRHRKIEALSKGYKQRCGLAQAILHDPPILILDEPTTGLDPNQIIEIRGLIKELGKSKTVILSTHILQEVEAVCDRVMIINEGRIAAQGTTDEIAGTMKGGVTWDLTLKAGESQVRKALPDLTDATGKLQRERVSASDKGVVNVSFFVKSAKGKGDIMAEAIFDWAVANGFKILAMQRKRLSLEDIFVRLTDVTGEEGGADAAEEAATPKKRKRSSTKKAATKEAEDE